MIDLQQVTGEKPQVDFNTSQNKQIGHESRSLRSLLRVCATQLHCSVVFIFSPVLTEEQVVYSVWYLYHKRVWDIGLSFSITEGVIDKGE